VSRLLRRFAVEKLRTTLPEAMVTDSSGTGRTVPLCDMESLSPVAESTRAFKTQLPVKSDLQGSIGLAANAVPVKRAQSLRRTSTFPMDPAGQPRHKAPHSQSERAKGPVETRSGRSWQTPQNLLTRAALKTVAARLRKENTA
jgi:hypothetical protein